MIDQIQSRARSLQLGRAALTLAVAPFVLVGYIGGALWKALVLTFSAIAEGFSMGSRR